MHLYRRTLSTTKRLFFCVMSQCSRTSLRVYSTHRLLSFTFLLYQYTTRRLRYGIVVFRRILGNFVIPRPSNNISQRRTLTLTIPSNRPLLQINTRLRYQSPFLHSRSLRPRVIHHQTRLRGLPTIRLSTTRVTYEVRRPSGTRQGGYFQESFFI